MTQKKKNLDQSDEPIHILNRIEHIRLRPGMYSIGGNDANALNNVVYHLLECVMQQARQNICTSLSVSILRPQTLQIRDNGEGIPPHKGEPTDKHHLEYLLQDVGSDFVSNWALSAKGIRWGMDRLILANAVSLHMHVEVRRDGAVWEQHYKQGRKVSNVVRVRDLAENEESGTCLTFTIDDEIFGDAVLDAAWIERRLFDIAHLIPGLKTSFQNVMTGHQLTHYYHDGIARYMTHLNQLETSLCPPMILHRQLRSVTLNERLTRPQFFEIDVAIQFLVAPHGGINSFANALEIDPRGQHTEACLAALTDMLLGCSSVIQRSDLPELFLHVRLVISLWHPGAMFESQTNRVLINRDIHRPIYEELSLALLLYFREHPDCIPQLEAIVMQNRKSRHERRRTMRII